MHTCMSFDLIVRCIIDNRFSNKSVYKPHLRTNYARKREVVVLYMIYVEYINAVYKAYVIILLYHTLLLAITCLTPPHVLGATVFIVPHYCSIIVTPLASHLAKGVIVCNIPHHYSTYCSTSYTTLCIMDNMHHYMTLQATPCTRFCIMDYT